MRIFEILLILVNLSSLLPSLMKPSRVVWLVAAGANSSLFLIHGILEGLRYQMVFSYIFAILFTTIALLRVSSKFEKSGTPRALRAIGLTLSPVFLALTSFLAYALPVFELPKPTGTYDVGIRYLHLVDGDRIDPFLDKSPKNRELMVKVYYPSNKDDSKPRSLYFRNSAELIRSFTAGYGMPDFAFSHLKLVKANAREGVQVSDNESSYPVVLFSHGAGTTMEVQTSQSEDLASHGYIVAAIDHTYVSAATAFPDRVVSDKEATTLFNTAEPVETISEIMADDARFVIERLGEMNEGGIDPFLKGRMNLDEIGAIGHSLGGAVAYHLAINESRVKAAIDLDGRVYTSPTGNVAQMAPFLMLANDKYHAQAIQNRESLLRKFDDLPEEEQRMMTSEFMYWSKEAYDEAYRKATQIVVGLADNLKVSGNLFTIEGSDHMKFTDIGLFIGVGWLREMINIGGETAPARCLEITEAVTTEFFDQHLKGESGDALESLGGKYPELKKVDVK